MADQNVIVSRAHQKVLVPAGVLPGEMSPEHDIVHNDRPYKVLTHGPRETVLLRRFGLNVPNPMLTYYDWPGNLKPFEVQKTTCELLSSSPRAYVLNDMGTGKTRTPLWAWDYLRRAGCANKLLIVAPLSTLYFVWAREITATLPGCRVAVLHGTRERRLKLLESDADVFIINHDGLRVVYDELLARRDIDTLVLDELAVYRNNSIRSKKMREFAQRFEWAWGMTGRPMPNAPTDVWNQCKILTPHSVPKYFRHAQSVLMTKVSQFVWEARPDAVQTAFSWMTPAVRYSLSDVTELPDVVYRTIDVEMTPEQSKVYTKIKTELAAMIKEQKITAVNAGVAMGKLLQVAGGWVYTKNPDFVALDAGPRINMLIEMVEEASHKIIIFAPYRSHISGLSLALEKADIEHAVVHGDVKDRDEIFSLFQNTNKYRVLLAHPECMAHGITLTAADTIIWWLPTASLETYEQANARIRRVGQKNKQQILHIQSTNVEKRLYSLLRKKQRLQDQFLRLLEEATNDR